MSVSPSSSPDRQEKGSSIFSVPYLPQTPMTNCLERVHELILQAENLLYNGSRSEEEVEFHSPITQADSRIKRSVVSNPLFQSPLKAGEESPVHGETPPHLGNFTGSIFNLVSPPENPNQLPAPRSIIDLPTIEEGADPVPELQFTILQLLQMVPHDPEMERYLPQGLLDFSQSESGSHS